MSAPALLDDQHGDRLTFELLPELEAHEPPEARDEVRMLVAWRRHDCAIDAAFRDLPDFLDPGDLVVVNTSATIPAAIDAFAAGGGTALTVHFSTELADHRWVIELRQLDGTTTERWSGPPPAPRLTLAGGATATLVEPYLGSSRLWVAEIRTPGSVLAHLAAHGRPIRYRYVAEPWPLATYQTVYATAPGSAEMPSAGRPFTAEVITRLVAKGIGVTPLLLHTGVASLDADEQPYPEWYRVPVETADRVNATRRAGGRVIAVGTTVVRALESAAAGDGSVVATQGWTDLVVTPERGVGVVDGLLTGWHEPEASHLRMLEAVAGRDVLERSYAKAIAGRYRWHEFGDVHLILP
ncbi:MAG: S-adenosylmethionine:tRNA ribosyltransferase-isomerase [Acidimicrobiales bacterium]